MGSSGYGYQLERFAGKTSDERLRKAVLDTLWKIWSARRGALLPYDWRGFAADWISLGEDSLLTIEVNDGQIMFWFYESVGWSQGLALHWLRLALSVRRGEFEAVFARLGFRIKPDDWPDLKDQYQQSSRLYFHADNGIGEPTPDGVYWQVKDGNMDLPLTPYDQLSSAARLEVEALQKNKRCRCCLCKELWPWKPEAENIPGFQAEREAVFICRDLGAIDVRKEGFIVAAGGSYDSKWTARADSLSGPWKGILALTDDKRHVDGIFEYENLLVAHASTNSGARYISTSNDSGKTWSDPALLTQFGKTKCKKLLKTGAPGEAFALPYLAKVLFHSTDGGQTFALVANPPLVGDQPLTDIHSLVRHHDRLFGVVETKRSGKILAVSADHGATFSPLAFPKNMEPRQFVPHPDALFCVMRGENASAHLLRSTDEFSTYSAHFIGNGHLTDAAAGTRGFIVSLNPEPNRKFPGGIFVSEDGQSFVLASSVTAPQVFADPTGDRLGFFFADKALFSLKKA